MNSIATLNGTSLPPQFSYRVFIPQKRMSTVRTANGVHVQYGAPDQVILGEDLLPFTIQGAYPYEFQALYDLYDTAAPVLYNFVGYWGEELQVYFVQLDQPTVRATLFDVSGAFQVMCIVTPMNAVCPSEW